MKVLIAHLERFPRYLALHSNRLPGITKGATYIKIDVTLEVAYSGFLREKKALLTVTHTGSFKLQKENIECCIFSGLTVYLLLPCFTSIHHFHIDHNAPCLPVEFYVTIVSYFSKVLLQSSQKIHYNGYAKFWGINEVHYGLCKNSELHARAHAPESGPYPASPVFLRPFLADFFAFITRLKPGSPMLPMHLRHSRRYCLGYYSDMRA